MVLSWRHCIYSYFIMPGPGDDSRTRLSLLWPRKTEVCTLYDLGLYGIFLDNHISMVFLGLFVGVQLVRDEWVYW